MEEAAAISGDSDIYKAGQFRPTTPTTSSQLVLSASSTLECSPPDSPDTLLGDKDELLHEFPVATNSNRAGDAMVILRIENIIAEVVDSLAESRSLFIPLKRRRQVELPLSGAGDSTPATKSVGVSFPGSTPREIWRFSTTSKAPALCQR